MSRVIRTLIFFDSDPGDEAQVHEVCAEPEDGEDA